MGFCTYIPCLILERWLRKIIKKHNLSIEIKDLKIGIGIEKKQRNKAEDNVTNTLNHIFVLYPEHTSTDLLSHAYYRDPYFDFTYG